MRQLAAAAAVAAVGVLVAACGGNEQSSPSSSSSTTTTTPSRPPVAQAALDGLLLTPAEVDGVMGATGMSTKEKVEAMPNDGDKQYPQGWKWPADCLFTYGPAEGPVYAGSGSTAVRGHDDVTTDSAGSDTISPELMQSVVLFPSSKEANAFFTTSSERWPACANRSFTTPGDADNPEIVWQVGALSTANNTLSIPVTVSMTKGANSFKGTCQRALTVRNNVAIDVSACGKDPGDLGVKAANQIAGKAEKA